MLFHLMSTTPGQVTKHYFSCKLIAPCSPASKLPLTTQNVPCCINRPTLCHKHFTVQTFVQQCSLVRNADTVAAFCTAKVTAKYVPDRTGPDCTTQKLSESYLLRREYPPFCPTERHRFTPLSTAVAAKYCSGPEHSGNSLKARHLERASDFMNSWGFADHS